MGRKEQLMSVCATLAKLKRICHFLSALLSGALNPLHGRSGRIDHWPPTPSEVH